MNSFCERHQKHAKFKCIHNHCSNLMCSECVKDEPSRSSPLLFCNVCKSNQKKKGSVVPCQPVTDASCRVRGSLQHNESNEKEDFSTVRVQLFPTNNCLELENEGTDEMQTVTVNEPEDHDQTESEIVNNDEHQIVTTDPQVALMNEDLILAQTMNSNERQRETIDSQIALMDHDFVLAQTMNQIDNDTHTCDTVHIPEWYIEIMTSDKYPERINKDIQRRCWLTDELQEEIRSHYPSGVSMYG